MTEVFLAAGTLHALKSLIEAHSLRLSHTNMYVGERFMSSGGKKLSKRTEQTRGKHKTSAHEENRQDDSC